MRIVLVLAITIPVLLAFGVACGGDDEKARVVPSPATDSEGEAEDGGDWEAEEEGEADAEEGDEGGAEEGNGEGAEADDDGVADEDDDGVADEDGDGIPDDDDLCLDTAAGDAVDDVGCSYAQVDQDNDQICDPGAPSDGPRDCDLIDDNCPLTPNLGQEDFDGDLEGDACDDDDDNDGFTDAEETDYGSDPLDDARVPENEDVNPGSCTDGVDNDGDGFFDRPPPLGDPDCF